MKKKVFLASLMLASMTLAGCGANNNAAASNTETAANAEVHTATAIGQGFDKHKDVVFATASVDSEGNLVDLDINEYLGIRSIGRIINNITKANEEELSKVDAVAEENKVLSEDRQYANYKYIMIDGRYFECKDAGKNVYVEIGADASIENLQDYMWENPEWWYEVMQNASENSAILKVAQDGEEVLAEIDGVKLAKLSDLVTFYGGLTKKEGYTKNFSEAYKTTAWAECIDKLTDYITTEGEVSEQLFNAANAEDTKEFRDTVTGATFGYPYMYVNVAKEAIEKAQAEVQK